MIYIIFDRTTIEYCVPRDATLNRMLSITLTFHRTSVRVPRNAIYD